MKTIKHGWIVVALALLPFASCVDELKFGNAFLEKAPGGSVVRDTVFNNAEYTRQFLTGVYALQYYGLPYANSSSAAPYKHRDWTGKWEALSDLWTTCYDGFEVYKRYYSGSHNAGYSGVQDKFNYTQTNVWEAVRYAYLFLENIEGVPNMDAAEKARLSAEAKCLIAARYWDMFRHYGGIPILPGTFAGDESVYENPRATVEETVDFMVRLLDEAAAVLPWAVSNHATEFGRWTKAGAMGLKTSILLFAASPLFNDDEPYLPGEAAEARLVWYGGYKPELWDRALDACEAFFAELNSNGQYALMRPTVANPRPEDYRMAFRRGYFTLTGTEVLHSTRVKTYDPHNSDGHRWYQLYVNSDRGYNPTQEYVEMFPWADGTPFDWDQAAADGTLDEMFIERVPDPRQGVTLTRDPRLYETAAVNGVPRTMDWATANMSGAPYETFLGGYDAAQKPVSQVGKWATGYGNLKYILDIPKPNAAASSDHLRQDIHWSYIRLAEVILNYAEVLCRKGQLQAAIDQVDILRARVGMGGLVECNPGKNLTSDSDALLAEILRERACELGLEDSRFFDLIRNKMKDRFEKPLHMLYITRKDGKTTQQWFGAEQDSKAPWPEFDYEVRQIANPTRVWWTNGFDPKWYLSPFPLSEMNKGYGLVQNPGW